MINIFIKTLKEEGGYIAFLRALKSLSLVIGRAVRGWKWSIKSLQREKVTKYVLGSKINLYFFDKGISKDLYIYGKREHLSTDLIISKGLINKGDIVLDLGANIGYYALLESKLVGKTGLIYAVEPSPKTFQILKENVHLNGISTIKLFNLAMGDFVGKAQMHISKHLNLSRMSHSQLDENNGKTISVDMCTVDEFFKDRTYPDLIRMDVEGYEIQIFRGMREIMAKRSPDIFIELHPTLMSIDDSRELFEILETNNYEVAYCLFNPSQEKNPFARYACKKLGELGDYEGKFFNMTLSQAKDWVISRQFRRLPHFVFRKKST
ncbi:MAG: FkbM family methyltransferase [Deltaproteobacteria bacterium]|nr:FkbM family methyltransferase [Deltaproteobacteria bacterium]